MANLGETIPNQLSLEARLVLCSTTVTKTHSECLERQKTTIQQIKKQTNKQKQQKINNMYGFVHMDIALTMIIPTWYRTSTQYSTVINIAARSLFFSRAGAVKIDAIFLPVISIVIKFVVPATSY